MLQTASAAGKFASRLFDTIRGDILQDPSPNPPSTQARVPVQTSASLLHGTCRLCRPVSTASRGADHARRVMHPHDPKLVDSAVQMQMQIEGSRRMHRPLSSCAEGVSTGAAGGALEGPAASPAEEENRQLLLGRIRNYSAEYEQLGNTLTGMRMFFAENEV